MNTSFIDFYAKIIDAKNQSEAVHTDYLILLLLWVKYL